MHKPKVMRIISDLPVGGVEQRLLALLPKLADRYDVQVCCIREPGVLAPEFERAGIPVVLKYFKSRLHPVSLYQLASYMRRQRIDIVHTHMYRPNISGVIAAKLAGVPVVISQVHNVDHWDNERQVRMDARLAALRDKVIAVSEAVKRDYVERTGIPPQKCVVIYNGIDLERFKCSDRAAQVRQEFKISPADRVVGIIARLAPAKDHATFLLAARRIQASVPNTKFLVVGEEDGPAGFLEQLKAQARELGLTGRVIFTGGRRDIQNMLSVMDVSVLSSVREGFANVILESMACGVPVVVTAVGGNAEAVAHGETGFIVPPKSPQALAAAIVDILQNDALAAAMRLATLERIKLFSLDTMLQKTVELYGELMAAKRPAAGYM